MKCHAASEWDEYKTVWDWRNLMVTKHPELLLLYRVVNERKANPVAMSMLKARGLCPGVFDWSLDVSRHGYHGLRIEQKKIGGHVSADQKVWMQRYSDNGYMALVSYGCDSVIKSISEYCGIKSVLID